MDLDTKFTPEFLVSIPRRKWDEEIHNVSGVYVLPRDEIHGSGFSLMDFVAEQFQTGNLIRFGGCCDAVSLVGTHFHIDCLPGSKVVRIWNRNPFTISWDLSDIDFTENEKEN